MPSTHLQEIILSSHLEQRPAAGLEFMKRALKAGGFGPGIGETLGLAIDAVDDGQVTLRGEPGTGHVNPLGAVHGGYLATLLDSAMGLALQTQLDMATRYATTDLNVTYVKGVRPDSGTILCVGSVIHRGRTLALTEARIVSDDGTLHAHATATFALSERPQ
jgi:uncharacterized protein (TIGR00369 family)